MTTDERLEALLNRAGQTISDLPKHQEYHFSYPAYLQSRVWDHIKSIYGDKWHELDYQRLFVDYILHLTDIIDRMETALENQVTLHDNLMHVIGNADVPDDVSYEQFCLVVDSVYKAVETAQEGWESYEGGRPEVSR